MRVSFDRILVQYMAKVTSFLGFESKGEETQEDQIQDLNGRKKGTMQAHVNKEME